MDESAPLIGIRYKCDMSPWLSFTLGEATFCRNSFACSACSGSDLRFRYLGYSNALICLMVTRGSKGTNLRYLRMLQTDNAILMRYKEMVIDKQDATYADQLSKKGARDRNPQTCRPQCICWCWNSISYIKNAKHIVAGVTQHIFRALR